tara:strand:+ start:523 stop:960 length:438 start_codon:yes stop_codon:yes gene_type:complete
MSRKLTFKGQLPIGEQDRIKLSTINGKTGYRITKFEIMSSTPGVGSFEMVGKIFKTDQTGKVNAEVNLTEDSLLAVHYLHDDATASVNQQIIMDNTKFNQDIFIYIADAGGNTIPGNYYIELETMTLSDLEATMLTLKNIRAITS